MAIEPSPTADATRFTEPWRASPAANTPGMLVSSANGLRSSGHADGLGIGPGQDEAARVPAHLGGEPVGVRAGSDHQEETGGGHGLLLTTRHVAKRQVPSQPSPPPPTTSVPSRTSMFGLASTSRAR